MNIDLEQNIKKALEEKFFETDAFLVDVKILGDTKIEIYMDCLSKNVTIEQCAETSRYLQDILETKQIVPEKYTLDVSSPGMGNPLKVMKQYQKCLNKKVNVLALDGIKKEGILIEYNDTGFVIEEHKPASKTKEAEIIRHHYLFETVKSVVKSFEFPKN